MGTNYYHERDGYEGAKCQRCGGYCERCGDEARVHIGKSSAGWVFGFHATDTIRSYRDWLTALEAGGRIVNEYGDTLTVTEFKDLVARKELPWKDGQPPGHHARQYPSSNTFTDPEGYSFHAGEFS